MLALVNWIVLGEETMKDQPVWISSVCDETVDAVCPKCGKAIPPAEVRRIDF
jgi:hypothetical protein